MLRILSFFAVVFVFVVFVVSACASGGDAQKKGESQATEETQAQAKKEALAKKEEQAKAQAQAKKEAEDAQPPATWAKALERYASTCPAPFFALPAADTVTIGAQTFALAGSVMTLVGPRAPGPFKIGVLGALKDAEPETRENVKKAMGLFKKAGVSVVVANGDLTSNETAVIVPVVQMLGEEVDVPVYAHSGNYEWTSAFSAAFADGAAKWPQLINGNIVRDVDFGGVHLVSLPGYFNRHFLQSGACHYSEESVAELTAHAKALAAKGDTVVLTSHGPPLGTTAGALDVTSDGPNVGDPQINALLGEGGVRFGIFGHILEAGGRAVDDVGATHAVKLPMKAPAKSLYINAGAASSFGWGMLDGKTARGMAAIVSVDAAGGSVEFIKLR